MKTAMKKLFSLVLVAVLLVGVMPFQAFADTSYGYYQIQIKDGKYLCNGENFKTAGPHTANELIDELEDADRYNFYSCTLFYANNVGSRSLSQSESFEVGAGDAVVIEVTEKPAPVCPNCGRAHEICDDKYCTECGWGDHETGDHNAKDTYKVYVTYVDPVKDTTNHMFGPQEMTEGDPLRSIIRSCDNPTAPDGYEFAGFKANGVTVTMDSVVSDSMANSEGKIFIQTQWKKVTYDQETHNDITIHYNNGEKNTFVSNVTEGTPLVNWTAYEPTKNGYAFVAWTYDEAGKNVVDADDKMPGNDIHLYAQYEKVSNTPETPEEDNDGMVTITVIKNDGTSDREYIEVEEGANILDSIKEADAVPTRKGYKLENWSYSMNDDKGKVVGKNDNANKDVTVFAIWHETTGDRDRTYTITVDYNYPRQQDDNMVIDGVERNTRMSNILRVIEDPSNKRDGYHFDYWAWDSNGKDPVGEDDLVKDDCTIYAIWGKKHYVDNEITLRIYLNGNTRNAAKVVDMDKYAKDGKISLSEVKEVIYNYYTAKNSKGLDIDGLYTSRLWNDGDYSWKDAAKSIEIDRDDDNVIYVMVRNAQSHTESTADSSNPKTGDMIFTPAVVLGASISALAVLFYLNKKRAV